MDNRLYYFMAHAPIEPQDWFNPSIDLVKPKFPQFPEDPEFHEVYDRYTHSPSYNPPDEFKSRIDEYQNAHKKYHEEMKLYNTELKKQRYIQWPLAWASEQVKLLMKNQL